MTQVVITGGAGFIGKHLARKFDNPVIVDHKVILSVETFVKLEELDEGAIVYHLASHPNQAAVKKDPYGAVENIVTNTLRLAELCKRKNAKLIYISSSMVYGEWEGIIREDAPLLPVNQYGILKMCAEQIVRNILPNNHVIVRPIAVYGPGDSGDRVVTKWIKSALKNEPIFINNPHGRLDFTYVKDLVMGLWAAKDGHGTYNMSGGGLVHMNYAAQIIKQRTRSDSEIVYTSPFLDTPSRGALSISKAYADFGYNPCVDFIEGVDETIASLV